MHSTLTIWRLTLSWVLAVWWLSLRGTLTDTRLRGRALTVRRLTRGRAAGQTAGVWTTGAESAGT